MNKAAVYNALAVIVPILCLLLGGFLTYRQYTRMRDAQDQLVQVNSQVAKTEEALRAVQAHQGEDRVPTVPPSAQEQTNFLKLLRAYIQKSGVSLLRISESPAPTGGGQSGTGLPPGVSALVCSVDVTGPYQSARGLLYDLLRAPRVFNVSDVKWTRDQDGAATKVSFNLTRYVSAQTTAAR